MKTLKHGAYLLARYSTDNQEQDSIEVQVRKCSEWCAQHNLPVLDIFADFAVSGMKDTRPQYDRMMQQLRKGMADTVVIYDQSRMFRKMTAWFQFRDELESLGIQVVSVTQPMIGGDLRDPANFLAEGSMALFNQMWVLQTRQKVVEKMRHMARNGVHTGGPPPLGYKVEDQRLQIEPSEAAVVRRIFEMYADGISYRKIAQVLNADGIVTRRGGPFGANSLHDLLCNKKYIGILTYGKTAQRPNGSRNSHQTSPDVIEIEDGCPAIIDRELWDAVQQKMAARRRTGGRTPTEDDLALRGRVFCDECGAPMHVRYSGGNRRYSYYVCSAQKRTYQCQSKPIRAQWLEHTIAQAVRDSLTAPVERSSLIEILRSQRDSIQGTAGQKMAALVARHRDVCAQLDNATNAILKGLTSDALIQKVHALENERDSLDYRIKELRTEVDQVSLPDDLLESILEQIIQSVNTDDAAILSIVYRVEVGNDAIKVWTILDSDPDRHEKITLIPAELPEPPPTGICAQLYNSPQLHQTCARRTLSIQFSQSETFSYWCIRLWRKSK